VTVLKNTIKKPIHRSDFRLWAGTRFYRWRRKLDWWLSHQKFASAYGEKLLPFEVFTHQSPILRELTGVEMLYQHNKKVNLQLALSHINGLVLNPGETFSFWKLVGKPTKSKGYLKGLNLKQGSIAYGYGGGLCQLGNLLFWMVGHSPLKVTERYRHGFDVFPDNRRTQPFGSGATLAYNYIDFQFTNPTQETFQLLLTIEENMLIGKILSSNEIPHQFKLEERVHEFRQQSWGGYTRHNEIWKTTHLEGDVIKSECVCKNDAIVLYEPFLERGSDIQ
jgi:vancomycin resistance protein VanW